MDAKNLRNWVSSVSLCLLLSSQVASAETLDSKYPWLAKDLTEVKDKYSSIVEDVSSKYAFVDPPLVYSVITVESGGRNVKSPRGALGLMQLMPGTAKDLGVKNRRDPHQNIDGGSKYLDNLIDDYDGNILKALAAYNWGKSNVNNLIKYEGENWSKSKKLPRETINFLEKNVHLLDKQGYDLNRYKSFALSYNKSLYNTD